MSDAPSPALALRWLLADSGIAAPELAVLAGVSPAAVDAFLGRAHAPTATWLALLAGLRCTLAVRTPRRVIGLALPRAGAALRARERRQWEARRLAAFRAQVQRQDPAAAPDAALRTARGYLAASAARLDQVLADAGTRLDATRIEDDAAGPRAALRRIARAAAITAEELALLAGVSLGAAQAALDEAPEGRLATPHRLFSALAARLVVRPAGGGAVAIALAPPGDWRPEAPRPGRSSLDQEAIRSRARAGESLASIARDAGVSRQRVHAIVNA